ncbi:hypothetical protein IEQ34_000464 [Dendrobium chrysotoxum]|uniref:Uncharacterized protein n=1 Tax=Dendrobium chrysotoxum TaxID=161865 RepID=A0AAV7HP98_DENCH|nr:hypothetical protein IEQ34_000464 [Dendrobium chrysotoxum]
MPKELCRLHGRCCPLSPSWVVRVQEKCRSWRALWDPTSSLVDLIIALVLDIKFLKDGGHSLTDDYMIVKLWDVSMDSNHVAKIILPKQAPYGFHGTLSHAKSYCFYHGWES